ncbi:hypothetical protein [Streptomyces spiralis]|uniref:hypothetical protein n=1 Tax=Streptomyces spiralis TaxID=66376 RepID=UPI0033C2498B
MSRAPSETAGSAAPARIPSLPGLGTSWYERGAGYWLRRVRTALLLLAVMALLCFASISLYQGFRTVLPAGGRPVADWMQVAASCVALVWGWVVQRRDHGRKLQDPPTPEEFRARKRAEVRGSVKWGVAGRGLLALAAPVMPAFAAWCVGWSLATLTVREYPSEVGARRALAGQ